MRTTVTIDDELLRATRELAAQENRTLGSILNEALRALLERSPGADAERRAAVDLPSFEASFTVNPNDNAAVRDAMERT